MTRQKTFKRRPPVAEERVVEATGRGWQEWFELLDGWNATSRAHKEIARWLMDEHDVPGWYSQSLTVGYEQARGLRAPGQRGGRLRGRRVEDRQPAGDERSRVALSHERLPDADAADEMKAWWRERLTELKAKLEAGELYA